MSHMVVLSHTSGIQIGVRAPEEWERLKAFMEASPAITDTLSLDDFLMAGFLCRENATATWKLGYPHPQEYLP